MVGEREREGRLAALLLTGAAATVTSIGARHRSSASAAFWRAFVVADKQIEEIMPTYHINGHRPHTRGLGIGLGWICRMGLGEHKANFS